MITKDQMLSVLVEACPSFAPQWEAFKDEWQEEAHELPLYLALADFARHLIDMLERGETAVFSAVFRAIEQLLIEGDPWVREAVTVGLLEALQNTNLHKKGTEPEQFRPFLGPEASKWWAKLYRFWQYGEILTED